MTEFPATDSRDYLMRQLRQQLSARKSLRRRPTCRYSPPVRRLSIACSPAAGCGMECWLSGSPRDPPAAPRRSACSAPARQLSKEASWW